MRSRMKVVCAPASSGATTRSLPAVAVVPEIETIPIQQVNEAYDRMEKSDIKYRFVIDMESLAN